MAQLSSQTRKNWVYGSQTPFAEPPWYRGCPSPHFKDSHRRLRASMRQWVEKNIIPNAGEWEEQRNIPQSVYELAAKDGILMPMAAGNKIPQLWSGKYPIIGDIKPKEWDGFHDFIIHDELMRVGGIGRGETEQYFEWPDWRRAIPAVQRFGSEALRNGIIHEILSGQKRICLAITEPNAGSDVRNIETHAELSDDKRYFIVNGQKKWITSGMYSDYFLTLVKDIESDGQSLLVIPRVEGVETRHMIMSGSSSAGTAFVDFENVKVPVVNLVGERGKAFKYIVSNFNHERLFISFQSLRCARVCLEDSIDYAMKRYTFGKKLIDHPVIRYKIAHMGRQTESLQSWIETLIYQNGQLTRSEGDLLLAGTTAQLKAHSGIVLEYVVREAIQILGGIGLTRGGRGERVERIWRDVKGITVPGGSEELMLDLAVRRSLKIQEALSSEGISSRL